MASDFNNMALTVQLGEKYGMSGNELWGTIVATVMPKEATDAETVAYLMVAKEYGLNPFLKEMHAFKKKGGGIAPVIGIDGWSAIANRQPQYDGVQFEYVQDQDGKFISCTATIHRKDRTHPTAVTEFLAECWRDTDAWKLTPGRMLRHRAFAQAIRYAFGISAAYDEEAGEYQMEPRDITPAATAKPRAPSAPSAPKRNTQKDQGRDEGNQARGNKDDERQVEGQRHDDTSKVVEGEVIPPKGKATANKGNGPDYRKLLNDFTADLDASTTEEEIEQAVEQHDILAVLQGSLDHLELAEEAIKDARARL